MCGIVAYVGDKNALPFLINGLKRLEYRGYDSAGVALITNNTLKVYKTKGKVEDLENHLKGKATESNIGMAHTRWATHGVPNTLNAHPHFSTSKNLAIIHNGIIENYDVIREKLHAEGVTFISETDTEVLIQFIEYLQELHNLNLLSAVQLALSQVEGAYAIVVIDKNNPTSLIAARKGSPMVVGIGDNEHFIASDATPIVEYTNKVVYLNEEEVVCICKDKMVIKTLKDVTITPQIDELEMSLDQLEKGGYDHFMLKEIHEQPRSILDSMRGRLNTKLNLIHLGGISLYEDKLLQAKRIIIVACGTSWHAGLVGEYLIEEFSRIPVEVEYASEFRYRHPILDENDVVLAISQSGETADTLAAIKLAKSKGATVLGICNVVGSSIARETDAGSYTHAGPEIGVASTKAFTAQVTILTLLAIMLGKKKGCIKDKDYKRLLHEIEMIPSKVEETLQNCESQVKELAKTFTYARNFLYLGRGYNYPVALEGALKLKEISYIHAEGYPAAEMKHGPIALIDQEMPVVIIAPKHGNYDKIVSNIQEVKARKGRILAIVTEGDEQVRQLADYVIEIPETEEFLVPLLATIPLQLLSYYVAVYKECNVDQPRNLAKSVTVE